MLTRATDSDVPAIVELMNVAFRATGSGASWNSEAHIIDGNRTTEELLRAELGERPDVALFVWRADPAGVIHGCVSLEPTADGVWYLGTLSVDPRLQNSGFGRRLLRAAEEWAKEQGARVIRLKVVNARETLIAWYVRRGYRLTGETQPFPYDDRRFGTPRRDDLNFVILDKEIRER
ncbi:MAG: GNAT family N-acetyltransferase [Steroidobacteraceae bacterium]|jgi:GNAT superfamily N-acetyltransferase